jgi:hypothetical protein
LQGSFCYLAERLEKGAALEIWVVVFAWLDKHRGVASLVAIGGSLVQAYGRTTTQFPCGTFFLFLGSRELTTRPTKIQSVVFPPSGDGGYRSSMNRSPAGGILSFSRISADPFGGSEAIS